MTIRVSEADHAPSFQKAALPLLEDAQLRKNVRHATDVITRKRGIVVAETPDWQELRTAGSAIKAHTMRYLDYYLQQFEKTCTAAGGHVHWASDADEANRIIVGLVKQYGGDEVIKIKTMTSEEIGLNEALEQEGIRAHETDLAEVIVQLGGDKSSHIVAPAVHKNRSQVRQIFRERMNLPNLSDDPEELTAAARHYPAREVSARADRHQRREFPDRGDGQRLHRGVGGQRTHVPDAAQRAHLARGHRENHPAL